MTAAPTDRDKIAPTALHAAVQRYLDGVEAGNSRKNARAVLAAWADWLAETRGVTAVPEVAVLDCREYARSLKGRVRSGTLAASSARTYYAYVRAFLSFCVADERIDANPAAAKRATDELPEDRRNVDRQFWRRGHRRAILRYVDELVADTEPGTAEWRTAHRDRTLVYVLALAGIRGGEVAADPTDEHRVGIRWRDVDTRDGTLRVLGKTREYEYAQLPSRAARVLDRYRRVLDPASASWPVFPTGHGPSRYRAARRQLADAGKSPDRIEALVAEHDSATLFRALGLVPPAITTNGVRHRLRRLCEDADLDIDGDYLKPHGARRGLGHELYANGHAELAQAALRHASIETTHEAYSDIRAAETAAHVDDIIDR